MSFKILGQIVGTGALADLYIVGSGKQAVTSSLNICNRDTSGAAAKFSIAVIKNGGAIDPKCYVDFEATVLPGKPVNRLLGITLEAGDKIQVNAPSSVSVNLFGEEV